jgi:segregation and condensation protein A
MTYQVHTRTFEGPLDLLLQLITTHQMEITDVSLSDLVTEYLSYLDEMRGLDLEVTSEFLLIAATLIQLKARHLLPTASGIDLDDELALKEERDRLLTRLLACLTFKDVAAVLAHRFEAATASLPRLAGLDADVQPAPPELRLTVTPGELSVIARRAIARQDAEPDLDHLDLQLPSVGDAISDLRRRMAGEVQAEFDELVTHCTHKLEVVAYFLAMLELARWGVVTVNQDEPRGAIAVGHGERQEEQTAAFVSEWGED